LDPVTFLVTHEKPGLMTSTETSQPRLRQKLRIHPATVSRVKRRAPRMVQVEFSGDDLRDFVMAGASDHIEVFCPTIGVSGLPAREVPVVGVAWTAGIAQPVGRDDTARRKAKGLVWAADEAINLRGVLHYLLRESMLPPEFVHVDGHWKRVTVAFDHCQPIED